MQNPLKPREIDILHLMADNLTNREIANRLHISAETVRWYAKRMYAKLEVSGRKEAVQKSQRLGFLQPTSSQSIYKPPAHNNIPHQLSSFVGRETHIQAVIDLLHHTRLLTLTGPGGIGKTRLAIRVVEHLNHNFQDGIYFIDLTTIQNSEDVLTTIANTLGLVDLASVPMADMLKSVLRVRHMLLIIDNFEHVMDAVRDIADLLVSTQHLKMLVTSREVLRLSGEQEYIVPPLETTPMDGSPSEATRLFTQRAQQVKPNFLLTEQNQEVIRNICKRIDNLPLAIELAAARCKLMSPQVLLKRLEKRLALLTGGVRDLPARHQTLQATIDWSYDLLNRDEQQLFTRLSVFRGGASLEAVEVICGHELTIDVFDGLASLVDKIMIQQQEDMLDAPRFTMLETLQEYASEQLLTLSQLHLIQHRHATYFMEIAEQSAPELQSSNQEFWFKRLDIEQNNFRIALSWALSGEAVEIGCRIVAALRNYWWLQGLHGEGWRWIEQALEFVDDISISVRANLLLTGGYIAYFRQDIQLSAQLTQQALAIYEQQDNQVGIAWSYLLPSIERVESIKDTIQNYQRNLDRMRDLNDFAGVSLKLNSFGLLYMTLEDYEKAEDYYKESYIIAQQIGDKRQAVVANGNRGELALRRGYFQEARQLLYDSLSLAQNISFAFTLHNMLWTSTILLFEIDQLPDALTIFGAAISREHRTGQHIYPHQIDYISPYIDKFKTLRMQSVSFRDSYDAGYQMSLDEAVDYVLTALSD